MSKIILLIISALILTTSTGETQMNKWNVLEGKQIYFGHQSVGKNILDGIDQIEPSLRDNFHDFYIGENCHPLSKIKAFEKYIEDAINSGKKIDIAVMKFCYVDIPNNVLTTREIFREYVAMTDILEYKYPDLKLIHMTIPLTTKKTKGSTSLPRKVISYGKEAIKKIINRCINKNAPREEYNEMVRRTFTTSVFDLAKIESENGRYTEDGSPALLPSFTDDGGHLNDTGKRVVATKFLDFLASIQMEEKDENKIEGNILQYMQ